MIKFYLDIFTTTSCTEFNEQFLDLKKQLQCSLLQSSIRVNGLSVTSAPQLSRNLDCTKWVLDYALALNTDLKETCVWDLALNKSLGAAGMVVHGIQHSKGRPEMRQL